ncbi:efflux RND transporter periplasmic adaptor subunit [Qipengyuania sp.]
MNMQQRVRLNVDRGLTSLADLDRRVVLAFLFGALALLAVIVLATRAGGSAAAPIGPTPVNVLEARPASEFERVSTYLGRVEPIQESGIGFEIGGAITSVLVDEGQSFGRGAPLARLDIDLLRTRRAELVAQRARARAEQRLAANTFSRLEGLAQVNPAAASELEIDAARFEAQAREASAAAISAQIGHLDTQIGKATLRAPFAGTVLARHADDGEVVAAGAPVLTIAALGSPRVRVGLPTDVAAEAHRLGSQRFLIGSTEYVARFERIVQTRNPATQTLDAFYRLPVAIGAVQAGAPARLRLRRSHPERGYWIPVSSLAESEGGLWSVYVVTEKDGVAELMQKDVELIYQEADRAFVRGPLAEGERIVRNGLHRLVPGMAVTPVSAMREKRR